FFSAYNAATLRWRLSRHVTTIVITAFHSGDVSHGPFLSARRQLAFARSPGDLHLNDLGPGEAREARRRRNRRPDEAGASREFLAAEAGGNSARQGDAGLERARSTDDPFSKHEHRA